MNVVVVCGPSGVGKTTLIEQMIAEFKARGLRVSVIKHAHKRFDIDQPGKDSFRHRSAGATEVLVASGQRLALLREYDTEGLPGLHQLVAELSPVDWVLVEGFKHTDWPKVEVWRAALGQSPLYPDDPFVTAIATDDPAALLVATARPVFDMASAGALVLHLLDTVERYEYHRGTAPQDHPHG
ncbi:MAG: molybdopterin-guanine dinucleotide biosynthesis protein B [Burkholderiales bacterium RIFCSPHIGHO2_12_FULL_69_20]|nr:MAG: molybdopterin-guanine dinucleotide biosynthesis protein B [Burkholderiales bacterium RIFCSPHIGHO2_12_FULL_69_20]